jgi:hypothetical protein
LLVLKVLKVLLDQLALQGTVVAEVGLVLNTLFQTTAI